jgi:hypothetical protein
LRRTPPTSRNNVVTGMLRSPFAYLDNQWHRPGPAHRELAYMSGGLSRFRLYRNLSFCVQPILSGLPVLAAASLI